MDLENERPMYLAPGSVAAGVTPRGTVLVRLGPLPEAWGFDSQIVAALELSPTECRAIAQLLTTKAREAEGGSSQTS